MAPVLDTGLGSALGVDSRRPACFPMLEKLWGLSLHLARLQNNLAQDCDFFESEESIHHAPRDVASKTKGF